MANRTVAIKFNITEAEAAHLQKGAGKAGRRLSEFCRDELLTMEERIYRAKIDAEIKATNQIIDAVGVIKDLREENKDLRAKIESLESRDG